MTRSTRDAACEMKALQGTLPLPWMRGYQCLLFGRPGALSPLVPIMPVMEILTRGTTYSGTSYSVCISS
jgi:hypothetical protein